MPYSTSSRELVLGIVRTLRTLPIIIKPKQSLERIVMETVAKIHLSYAVAETDPEPNPDYVRLALKQCQTKEDVDDFSQGTTAIMKAAYGHGKGGAKFRKMLVDIWERYKELGLNDTELKSVLLETGGTLRCNVLMYSVRSEDLDGLKLVLGFYKGIFIDRLNYPNLSFLGRFIVHERVPQKHPKESDNEKIRALLNEEILNGYFNNKENRDRACKKPASAESISIPKRNRKNIQANASRCSKKSRGRVDKSANINDEESRGIAYVATNSKTIEPPPLQSDSGHHYVHREESSESKTSQHENVHTTSPAIRNKHHVLPNLAVAAQSLCTKPEKSTTARLNDQDGCEGTGNKVASIIRNVSEGETGSTTKDPKDNEDYRGTKQAGYENVDQSNNEDQQQAVFTDAHREIDKHSKVGRLKDPANYEEPHGSSSYCRNPEGNEAVRSNENPADADKQGNSSKERNGNQEPSVDTEDKYGSENLNTGSRLESNTPVHYYSSSPLDYAKAIHFNTELFLKHCDPENYMANHLHSLAKLLEDKMIESPNSNIARLVISIQCMAKELSEASTSRDTKDDILLVVLQFV